MKNNLERSVKQSKQLRQQRRKVAKKFNAAKTASPVHLGRQNIRSIFPLEFNRLEIPHPRRVDIE